LGAGHSIKNLKTGKYLSVKSLSKEAYVVASDYPAAWFIREVRVPEENTTFCEYDVPPLRFPVKLINDFCTGYAGL